MLTIGILALQGSVAEHKKALEGMDGVRALEVRTEKELSLVDGIIMPGGESTTIGKLLKDFGLMKPLEQRIREGMPVWGTCAGLILLSNRIADDENVYLGVLDATVRRNAYGSQLDSFKVKEVIPEVSGKPLELVFIRAPWVEKVGEDVQVLAKFMDKVVAVRQENILGTSFHPELTEEKDFHRYFVSMCRENIRS